MNEQEIEALRLGPDDIIIVRGGEADEEFLEQLASQIENFIVWLPADVEIWSQSREELIALLQTLELEGERDFDDEP